MKTFGLIGKSLEHSFSSRYFEKKFLNEGIIDMEYINFEIKEVSQYKKVIKENKLYGLNVTNPFKEKIIPFLDEISKEAKEIGAVNTIRFKDGKATGYNTDYIGFKKSISPLLKDRKNAILLGDGGVAKAIKYALKELGIKYKTIKRECLSNYNKVGFQINASNIIINTTPLGTYPKTDDFPKIPYENLNNKYLLFDVIYNPIETKFLLKGKEKNAVTKNGLEMLQIQAEESWNIWNK